MKVQLPAFLWMKSFAQLWRNVKSDERHQRDVFLQSVFGHYNKGARQVQNLDKSKQVLLQSASGGGGVARWCLQLHACPGSQFGWCGSQAAGT